MVTLKKLAKELNVSVSTVSKALHDSEEISADTIKRVKELAKIYNYKPNQLALNLKSKNSRTIGVIIPDVLNYFFTKVLHGIEKEASQRGYNIITCLSNESLDKEKQSFELLSNGSVDGFIVSVAEETQNTNGVSHFQNVIDSKIPLVMFDRVLNNVNCPKVVINDYSSAYEATIKLLNENRKKIALISNISDLSVGKLRTNGYLKAISEAKYYKSKALILTIKNQDQQEQEIEGFVNQFPDIDGIIAIDNTSGVIALHKALRAGKSIPEDMSIIGFSDNNVLPFTDPKLSTVAQHPIDIARQTVSLLIDKIENKNPKNEKILIQTELILRGTTIN